MRKLTICIAGAGLAVALGVALAATQVIAQKDKKFSVAKIKVKLGDTLTFRNDDSFFHNVFSLSSAKSFDLGSYGKGESRSVIFDKEGVVEVECAIHPEMKMVVEVAK